MFAVIFEVHPAPGQWDNYLGHAKLLRPELEKIDGFVDNLRYRSLTREGWILSLSSWRDEKAVVRWRTRARHHDVQENHVGTHGRTPLDGLGTRSRLSHDLDVFLDVQDGAQTDPHQFMIVEDEHSNLRHPVNTATGQEKGATRHGDLPAPGAGPSAYPDTSCSRSIGSMIP